MFSLMNDMKERRERERKKERERGGEERERERKRRERERECGDREKGQKVERKDTRSSMFGNCNKI